MPRFTAAIAAVSRWLADRRRRRYEEPQQPAGGGGQVAQGLRRPPRRLLVGQPIPPKGGSSTAPPMSQRRRSPVIAYHCHVCGAVSEITIAALWESMAGKARPPEVVTVFCPDCEKPGAVQ